MKTVRRLRESGQDLVEFAITLPLFLLIVLAIFDLGKGMYSYSALQNATREGARYAIVHPCETDAVRNVVRTRALAVDPGSITVTAVVWGDETVQVSSELAYRAMTPIISVFLPLVDGEKQIIFTSSSTMQRETWASPDCAP